MDLSKFSATNISIPTAVGTVILDFGNMSLAGLNTWSKFDMFKPDGNFSLNSVMELGDLDMNLTVSVKFIPVPPSRARAMGKSHLFSSVFELLAAQEDLADTVTIGL